MIAMRERVLLHTERVGEVENGGDVQRPGSTEATLANSSSDISKDIGKRHSVVDDDGQHQDHLQRMAEKGESLTDRHVLQK